MSCKAWEERIALYAGGDLTGDEQAAVERHLAECAPCADLAGDLQCDRAWLRERPRAAAQIDYRALRGRVLEQVAQTQPRWRWLPAVLAAAALLLTLGIATMRRASAPTAVARPVPMADAVLSPRTASAPLANVRHRTAKRVRKAAPRPQELTLEAAIRMFEALQEAPEVTPAVSVAPVEMRIATEDPSVTIVLLPEQNGDSR